MVFLAFTNDLGFKENALEVFEADTSNDVRLNRSF